MDLCARQAAGRGGRGLSLFPMFDFSRGRNARSRFEIEFAGLFRRYWRSFDACIIRRGSLCIRDAPFRLLSQNRSVRWIRRLFTELEINLHFIEAECLDFETGVTDNLPISIFR